ncbi:MAG: 50S ribosomal protein L22 [Candidatus Pacebacteria bacterium]|nr:50S ribosomal protein L22 [Candidatus Paceibacterota bacterium]
MEIKAKLRYLKTAPRKTRLLADLVRGMSLKDAEMSLKFNEKKSSTPILKLLKSAESNARNNHKIGPENLFVKEIKVDEGPVLKRHMPRARGRATVIRRRMSHVTVVLAEKPVKELKEKKSDKK